MGAFARGRNFDRENGFGILMTWTSIGLKGLRVARYELPVAGRPLRVAGCQLRVIGYGFRVMGCALRVAGEVVFLYFVLLPKGVLPSRPRALRSHDQRCSRVHRLAQHDVSIAGWE